MSDRKWLWVQFDNAIPHLVCAGLLRPLIKDLEDRDCKLAKSEICKKIIIDLPGMIHTKRPWESFSFMGVEIGIPCEDVASFVVELTELKERRFINDMPYFKLHGFHRAFTFTPAQKDAFLDMLKQRINIAEERATIFYADKKPASVVLREAAVLTTGKPLESIPDLGGHKNDRYMTHYLDKDKEKDFN